MELKTQLKTKRSGEHLGFSWYYPITAGCKKINQKYINTNNEITPDISQLLARRKVNYFHLCVWCHSEEIMAKLPPKSQLNWVGLGHLTVAGSMVSTVGGPMSRDSD